MPSLKPPKTTADYMVIAVSPALIMVMVHSLCFFLVEVFYRGEAAGSVRWVLFWFVLAVVLIARMGIEQGTAYALGYGLMLALATWLYLSSVQPNVVFGALLLGIVWFTAHKITCNCTLIDEDADASGKGLLQSLQPVRRWFKKVEPGVIPTAKASPIPKVAAPTVAATAKPKSTNQSIPGIWLIYYSLAALPLFGLGQMLLPAGDWAARRQSFIYLFLYLAAALGLLVTTSFLGLRRYLRQRYVVMPSNIALGWIKFGGVVLVLVLGISLLMPRPGTGEAWSVLRYQVNYQLGRASEYAAKFNPHGTGSGRSGQQSSPQNPQNPPSSQVQPTGQPQESNDHQGPPLPHLSSAANAIYPWLKILFFLAIILGVLWFLYRYWTMISNFARSLWTDLVNFLASLFGGFGSKGAPAKSASRVRPKFKSFKNPFLSGADRLWSPERLIVYSFDALQSWALESPDKAGSPQTPRELCGKLGEEMPEAADALTHLAFLYGHVAYGSSLPANYQPEQLRQLWDIISRPRPIVPNPVAT
jgi:hypothetical protein